MNYKFWILLLFSLTTNLHAETLHKGVYLCESSGQSLEITNSSLLIGSADFQYVAKLSNGRIDAFVYDEDVAFAFPITNVNGAENKSSIQIQFWKFDDLKNKKSPKFILVCNRNN